MDDAISRQLTPSQQRAVSHVEGPLLVVAGPGSGKTRVVTFRIAALVRSGVVPASICEITFTNKAADEMRQRAQRLGASAGAHISTFHSLCVRILRQYADQDFSYVDAVSFALMHHRGLTDAFAFDQHFVTAGVVCVPPAS